MKHRTLPLALALVLGLGACTTMTDTQRNAGLGAVGGAVGGALIGKATGSDKVGRDAAIGAGLGALGGYVWSQRMEAQRQAMSQATAGTGVEISRTADDQLKLEIPSDISFDVGRSDIKPDMRPILARFAQTLKDNPATAIRIVGHTDSTGGEAVNRPLSLDRAMSARDFLVDRGVAASRVGVTGRGEQEPIASNATEAGRAKNRRIEIFVGEPGK
ncbi:MULTISPECIES: OmpA family protein [Zoogloea]|jgi:outer membrane protein OmpA-like peptidoglycan-associated protein|uniref:OmpA family lipoprotein n=1 Tax=Zoogloea oryzae TaxID=310767 RepID=A0ABQ6FBE9_9RHOO|nr:MULTISPECIES: OmpA family protein [Zoogloea]GLT22930.1 OmpA family lipoprotein [Zoogloea oryzae]